MTTVLKVAAHTNPNKVAGALAGYIREDGKAEILSSEQVLLIKLLKLSLLPGGLSLLEG